MIELDSTGNSRKIIRVCILLFVGTIVLYAAALTLLKYPGTILANDLIIHGDQASFEIEPADRIKIETADKIVIRFRGWRNNETAYVGSIHKAGQAYIVTSVMTGHAPLPDPASSADKSCTIYCQPKNLIRLLLFYKVGLAN